ncbi:MAG: dependent oxidoreductase, partial [Peptococcaceae bacterium]|nr:dependent oxidoreductase [Peptococcaceae bacterium]
MIRVAGLKLSLEEGEERLLQLIAKKLHVKTHEIKEWHIYKQSVDARKSQMIYFIYTVDVVVKDEAYLLGRLNDPDISLTPNLAYEEVEAGSEVLKHPPVIIGTGPAGLFAGLLLAQRGYQPVLLERGDEVDQRSDKVRHFWNTGELDPESNVQFGEGGAGTFSDGKLTTLIKDKRCRKVLEELVQAGAPPDILYSFKPHIGTDVLRRVVKNLRQRITELGGQVLFRSKVTDLVLTS